MLVALQPANRAVLRLARYARAAKTDWRSRSFPIVGYFCSVTGIYQVLLFNFNSDSFFSPIGWLDPFHYVGYGLYYAIPDLKNNYHKVSRVPWDLLQFAARQIFRPDIASFALQFVCFSAMSIAAYLFFRQLINRAVALLIALLLIFFPIAYANGGGADYHNTITGALYFAMLALVATAIAEESLLIAGCAGGAIALALHTNPTLVMLAPGIALHSLALWWVRRRRLSFALVALVCLIVGGAAATAALGLVSAGFGRGFLFFMPQLQYLQLVQASDHNLWPYPLTLDGLMASKVNGYVFGVSLVSAAELGRLGFRRQIKEQLEAAAAHAAFIMTYLIAVVLQIRGQPILEPAYMLYSVVLAAFVPVGYLLNSHVRAQSTGQFGLFATVFPIACGGAIFGSAWIYSFLHLNSIFPAFLALGGIIVLYFGLVAARVGQSNVAMIGLLALLNVMLIPVLNSFTRDRCHSLRDLNVFISDASVLATRMAGHPQRVSVFADPEERVSKTCFNFRVVDLSSSFTEVAHKFLGKPYGQQQLDELTRDDFAPVVGEGGKVVLFAAQTTTATRLLEQARRVGVQLDVEAILPVLRSGVRLYVLRPRAL